VVDAPGESSSNRRVPDADRRLAAILSADVSGYSRLMADDEDATVRTLRAWREQVSALIAEHRGRLADFTGDNFLAEFPAARDAVECALEIQRVIAVRNAALPEARRMRFRIGAHLGDVRHEDGRLFGDGVNVAARLQPLAEPGGLCLSAALVEQVRGKIALALEDLGPQNLKNLPSAVHAYRVRVDTAKNETASATPAPADAPRRKRVLIGAAIAIAALAIAVVFAARSRDAAALTPIRSIAVLPLTNLSGDPEQEYYADGMTETLIAELAKLPGVRVISRTSVMQFKGARTPLPEIARLLNVDGVIEGSVMRAGDEVRITAQLVDARSDQHVWAEQYDRELAHVLEIQSEVARAVAQQIALALTPEQAARLKPPKRVDPRAQEAYFRGLALRARDRDASLHSFEEAVQIAPEFAPAWAALSLAHASPCVGGCVDPRGVGSRAREAAVRAITLEATLADSHVAMGVVHALFDWNSEAAEREFRRAAELSSVDFGMGPELAWTLLITGRREEALAEYDRWMANAPDDLETRLYQQDFLRHTGRIEQALELTTRALEDDPDDPVMLYWQAENLFSLGRHADAIPIYKRVQFGLTAAEAAEVEQSWREGGLDGLSRVAEQVDSDHGRWTWAACDALLRNDREAAFGDLERAFEKRDPFLRRLTVFECLAPLHSDPRFSDLARRMNLPLPKP
jgi:TolB-like protein/class 3 adenylate cyclase